MAARKAYGAVGTPADAKKKVQPLSFGIVTRVKDGVAFARDLGFASFGELVIFVPSPSRLRVEREATTHRTEEPTPVKPEGAPAPFRSGVLPPVSGLMVRLSPAPLPYAATARVSAPSAMTLAKLVSLGPRPQAEIAPTRARGTRCLPQCASAQE